MDEDDWKRRAIANDMLAFSSQGQKPSDYVREAYEEDGTRLVERYGKKKVWRYQYSPDGDLIQVVVTTIKQEWAEINSQWDSLAQQITTAHLAEYEIAITKLGESPVRFALNHIWRRRPDLRAEIKRRFPGLLPR